MTYGIKPQYELPPWSPFGLHVGIGNNSLSAKFDIKSNEINDHAERELHRESIRQRLQSKVDDIKANPKPTDADDLRRFIKDLAKEYSGGKETWPKIENMNPQGGYITSHDKLMLKRLELRKTLLMPTIHEYITIGASLTPSGEKPVSSVSPSTCPTAVDSSSSNDSLGRLSSREIITDIITNITQIGIDYHVECEKGVYKLHADKPLKKGDLIEITPVGWDNYWILKRVNPFDEPKDDPQDTSEKVTLLHYLLETYNLPVIEQIIKYIAVLGINHQLIKFKVRTSWKDLLNYSTFKSSIDFNKLPEKTSYTEAELVKPIIA